GTGLAGAGVAAALARRGWEVTAVAHAAPATSSGPGHVAAALTPLADPADSRRARLTRAGALRALHRWRSLMQPAGGAQAAVSQVGTVQVAKAARARTEEELARWQSRIAAMRYPPDWLRVIGEDEAAELAGQPVGRAGLYFPCGLLLRPEPLCAG